MGFAAPLAESLNFLLPNLPPRPGPLLEAGCGKGALAAELMTQGWIVTAIDSDPDAVAAACARGVQAQCADFLNYSGAPCAALLFARSLHHLHPLLRALNRAHGLLRPGGLLLVEEVALETVDAPTAEWFFARWDPLREASNLPAHRRDPGPEAPALERWRALHAHEPPLHSGVALREGIAQRFKLEQADPCPALFRYFDGFPPPGEALAARILEEERKAIASGRIRTLGLNLVARR